MKPLYADVRVAYPDGSAGLVNLSATGAIVFPNLRKVDLRAAQAWLGEEEGATRETQLLRVHERDRPTTLAHLLFADWLGLVAPLPVGYASNPIAFSRAAYPYIASRHANHTPNSQLSMTVQNKGWMSLYQERLAFVRHDPSDPIAKAYVRENLTDTWFLCHVNYHRGYYYSNRVSLRYRVAAKRYVSVCGIRPNIYDRAGQPIIEAAWLNLVPDPANEGQVLARFPYASGNVYTREWRCDAIKDFSNIARPNVLTTDA